MQSKTLVNTLTDGATVAVDFSISQNHKLTAAGNRTLTFSNPQEGEYYNITIIQDATGSRTITWPSTVKWAGGSAPTLTTTAVYRDHITFFYDGTYYRDVAIVKNYAA